MGDVLVDEADQSDAGQDLVEDLPVWMSADPSEGNFKVLDTIGRAFDRLDDDIEEADSATTVQDADSVAEIEQLGRLVETPPKENEPIEKYRARVIASFQAVTTECTAKEIIENSAEILQVDKSNIEYTNPDDKHAYVELNVPGKALDDLSITESEFLDIVRLHVAAGFNLRAFRRGTFTYITPTTYNNDNHTASEGYDGLDSNGDPKDNGGTYAGLIE